MCQTCVGNRSFTLTHKHLPQHQVLNSEALAPFMLGAKCVGAGGDGTAQILCKDAAAQAKVMEIVVRDLGMKPLPLTLQPTVGMSQ